MFLRLAIKSLRNRLGAVILTLLALTVSIFVVLSVNHIREQSKASFASTVSGIDLIVGAKTSPLNLLLYSIFHIGSASSNIQWQSYKTIKDHPNVAWTVPISLGDSHRGFHVVGTTTEFFEHFRYGSKQRLLLAQGYSFTQNQQAVIGANVAGKLNYQLGDELVLSHGLGSTSFTLHKQHPVVVTGILIPTGTPVDQSLFITLKTMDAIHKPDTNAHPNHAHPGTHTPLSITAFFMGLKSKMATFQIQRDINAFSAEPLLAILPGVTLMELWRIMSALEKALILISVLVLLATLLGLSALLLVSMRERKAEIQLLRTIGASPLYIFLLIQFEALIVTVSAIAMATSSLWLTLGALKGTLSSTLGLHIQANPINDTNILILSAVLLCTFCVALIPAFSAYIHAREQP